MTAKETLKQIPWGYRTKLRKNLCKYYGVKSIEEIIIEINSAKELLYCFRWRASLEGVDFWRNLTAKIG